MIKSLTRQDLDKMTTSQKLDYLVKFCEEKKMRPYTIRKVKENFEEELLMWERVLMNLEHQNESSIVDLATT